MQSGTIRIIILALLIGGTFAWVWRKGHLTRLADYIKLTREELRKCSWPSWEELKGSTVVVAISIAILGGFTVVVDQIFFRVFMLLNL